MFFENFSSFDYQEILGKPFISILGTCLLKLTLRSSKKLASEWGPPSLPRLVTKYLILRSDII